MSRITLPIRNLAQRLIIYETRERGAYETKRPSAFLVCERLRPPLAARMGTAGFRALLSRAVALANAKSAWPHPVQVNMNGSLEGLDELEGQVPLKEFAEGSVVLIAELLGLLAVFIGEELTFRQLDEVWSEATHHEQILPTEKNEKTG